ncbi:MAG: threonine synthase [Candidatus Paceibacterota bacterium]
MRFFSTSNKERTLIRSSFKEVIMEGQAPDGGLYMPEYIPSFSEEELSSLSKCSLSECAYALLSKYVEGEIPDTELKSLLNDAYTFEVPIQPVYGEHSIMRLDEGPTASFKDIAAQAMARMVGYFLKQDKKESVILVATSGDTGSAVAHAYHKIPGVTVVILFPEGEVSERQRKQMTTLKDNVHAIAVKGKFDDCQRMVKKAFADTKLAEYPLTSANSINLGRLLPQASYYLYAYAQINKPLVYAIPSGNFGNMMGGMIASRMGVPVVKFVIGVNDNDSFPLFLKTDTFSPITPSRNSISNAMNVGHPSNLARIVSLFGGTLDGAGNMEVQPNMNEMRSELVSVSVNDAETKAVMKKVYDEYGVILEPHGAVGWSALHEKHPELTAYPSIVIETAHPAKFNTTVKEVLNVEPPLPESISVPLSKEEEYTTISSEYDEFVSTLLKII